MKTIRIKRVVVTLLCAVMVTGFCSCTTDTVEMSGGILPDKEPLENTYGFLKSVNTAEQAVDLLMTQGSGSAMDKVYYRITQPAPAALSLDIQADLSEETLNAFNLAREAEWTAEGIEGAYLPYKLLPGANFEFPDGKTLAVAQHGNKSEAKRIKILGTNLAPGYYLLPVTVAQSAQKGEKQQLFYTITIRQPQLGDEELHQGNDMFFVFYINTNQYQPLLVDDYFMQKKPRRGNPVPGDGSWYNTIGNIINLRTVTLNYEAATKRAKLNLGKDMTHVLNQVVKYIRPLQDKGRKVCLSIEGGGSGLGFCNLTDGQLADFTAQIKAVVASYDLDGINLWDRNSGYGKEGMPATNTTSYPKLIKALRTALGADKLLTLTVYGKPTETFYDPTASGGIAVGDYIDYAWSGYDNDQMAPQLLDPWRPNWQHPDQTTYPYGRVSAYTQQPIANLDPAKFGCINFPLYGQNSSLYNDKSFVAEWIKAGYKPNKIVVFSDLRTNLQDGYEGYWAMQLGISCQVIADDGSYSSTPTAKMMTYRFDQSILDFLPSGVGGYGKWLKDW